MNKKAYIEDFMAFIAVAIAIGIVGVLVILLVNNQIEEKHNKFKQDVEISEASLMTRTILNYDVREGYKTYDLIVDGVNRNAYNYLYEEITKVISRYYAGSEQERWVIMINDECVGVKGDKLLIQTEIIMAYSAGDNPPTAHVVQTDICRRSNLIPKVTIPNPYGDNILVAIFPESPILAKDTKRVAYGFRAGQIGGYSLNGGLHVSHDGKPLDRIQGIPNVECTEEGSSVGRYCLASPELVAKLRELSRELVDNDQRIIVTQAYRDWEIQNELFQKNLKGYDENGKPITDPPACNPGPNPDQPNDCPHMITGAIDIVLCDKNGDSINFKNPGEVERFMCSYGFVRYANEAWHFEYGTPNWESAYPSCTYAVYDPSKYNKNKASKC